MIELLAAVEALDVVRAIRTSRVLYPLLNGTHILSFGILIGAIAVFDLQVIRRGPDAARDLAAVALPVARGAFAAAVVTGLVLFACRATHYATNPAMLWKLGLLGVALANVALFHWMTEGSPAMKRASALVSLLSWICVLFAGRWIGFL